MSSIAGGTRDGVWTGILVIIAVGAALRCYQIETPTLWYDEAFSWRISQLSPRALVEKTALDVHPPFYYIVLKVWTGLFGDGVVAMRALSAALGVLCIPVAYKLTLTALDQRDDARRSALLAATLMALNGYSIYYSQQVRMYSLAVLLSFSATLLFLEAARSPGDWRFWLGYGLASSLLAYSHNFGILVLAAHVVFVAVTRLGTCLGDRERRLPRSFSWRFALVMAGVALLYAPWMTVLIAQVDEVKRDYWTPPFHWGMPLDTLIVYFSGRVARLGPPLWDPSYDWTLRAVAGAAFAVVAFRLLALRTVASGLLLACALVPSLILIGASQGGRGLWVSHPLQVSLCYLIVAVAVCLGSLGASGTRRWITAYVLGLSLLGTIYEAYWIRTVRAPGMAQAIATLARERKPGEPVIVNPSRIHQSAVYYSCGQLDLHVCGPPWEVFVGIYSDHNAHKYIIPDPEERIGHNDLLTMTGTVWVLEGNYLKAPVARIPAWWKLISMQVFRDWFPPEIRLKKYEAAPPVVPLAAR